MLRSLAEIVVPALGTWLAVWRLDPLGESTFGITAKRVPSRLECVELFHTDSELAPALLSTLLVDFPFTAGECRGRATADATEQEQYGAQRCDLSQMRFTLAPGQDARDLMKLATRTAHAVTVPVAAGDRVLGAMTLGAPAGPHPDREVLADLALRAATALEHLSRPDPQAAQRFRAVAGRQGTVARPDGTNRSRAPRTVRDPTVALSESSSDPEWSSLGRRSRGT